MRTMISPMLRLLVLAGYWAGAGMGLSQTAPPPQAAAFEVFAPKVKLRWDAGFLYVESNGLPSHNMMVGITAWQQQVPLPQPYTGENAWRVPLHPVPAKEPRTIEGHFLRGAVALAANGIPIFNPQNNRGEVSAEIGELDQWGGHCGRGDDYHYHVAPLHLERALGKTRPIAWALDGYAIYGLTEPDGSPVGKLDKCHGHETAALGYHYHAATRRPYVLSAFHGEVVERGGQVDPQPHAQPVRRDQPPLRGAKITGFKASPDEKTFALEYQVNEKPGAVKYASVGDGAWKFQFVSTDGTTTEETYRAGDRRGSGGPPREGGPQERRKDRPQVPEQAPQPLKASVQKPDGSMVLESPAIKDGEELPVEYTGDGGGVTPPLQWSGAPAGTKSYAIIMHHTDPVGAVKWYWTLYDIPADVRSLPENVSGVGKTGTGFKGKVGYEPPHSRGPGRKTYTITLYALSSPAKLTVPPAQVNRETLLAAMQGSILASADLNVAYTSKTATGDAPDRPRPGSDERQGRPRREPRGDSLAPQVGESRAAAPSPGGIVKPALADTIKASIYADNWFMLYINGKPVAVDPIDFLPHNVVTLDILPEYPMTIAVMAKDNADPKTGMEYGNHIGDGGFILKFADGTVSNASWKAKCFFKGPLNRDVANPKVERTPLPANWFAVDFDDSAWANAVEYTEERVNPKEAFKWEDFAGAKFIWSGDLDLDNTVLFRARIEKPGWNKRWNTKPDLDVNDSK